MYKPVLISMKVFFKSGNYLATYYLTIKNARFHNPLLAPPPIAGEGLGTNLSPSIKP